jgi:hypothetical protein
MDIEYEDETVVQDSDNVLKTHELLDINDDLNKYKTNTKNIDVTTFTIISPEEVDKIAEQEELNNPNPEFTQALKDIEKMNSKPLSKEEYFKAANAYATILAERDEEKKKNYEGKYDINPIKKDKYLELILTNKPVTNAFAETMKDYENSVIAPLIQAYEQAQKEDANAVLELKRKNRINLRYKGKCRIASDEGGKIIIIDNKNDVDLLRMKYRKEWIEKKYPERLKGEQTVTSVNDDEYE